jgi:hypothetical protein
MTMLNTAKCLLAIAVIGALTSTAVPAFARVVTDQQRASGAYPVYLPGSGGCIDDRGQGIVNDSGCGDN